MTDEPDERIRCTGAKGACPPDDCGGAWSCQNLKYVLAHPEEAPEETAHWCGWLGLERPEEFDPAKVTGRMAVEAAPAKPRARRRKSGEGAGG